MKFIETYIEKNFVSLIIGFSAGLIYSTYSWWWALNY